MPEVYLISFSIVEEAILPAVHESLVSSSLSRFGEKALRSALEQSGLPSSKQVPGFWGGIPPELPEPAPFIHVTYPGGASMQAVFSAARMIAAGDGDTCFAGGAGQAAPRAVLAQMCRQYGLKPKKNLKTEYLKGAGALVLASTEAVGVYNLSPQARIAARVHLPFNAHGPQERMKKVVETILIRQQIDLDDIDFFLGDFPCDGLQEAWKECLLLTHEVEGERLNSYSGQTGEALGAILVARLAARLQQRKGTYGLALQAAWDGTLMACLMERV